MIVTIVALIIGQWHEERITVIQHVAADRCVAYLEAIDPEQPWPQSEIVFDEDRPTRSIRLEAKGCRALQVQWEIHCPSWAWPSRHQGVLPVGAVDWVKLAAQLQSYAAQSKVGVDEDDIPAVSSTMTGACVIRWRQCSRGNANLDCVVDRLDVIGWVEEYKRSNPETPWRLILDDWSHLQNDWSDGWIERASDPPTVTISADAP